MYDIIGDIHGCSEELELLLQRMGYSYEGDNPWESPYAHPYGRQAVFCGDFVDRGPNSPMVLGIIRCMVKHKTALAVEGNHDNKLKRYLKGNNVKVKHGLQSTIDQLEVADRNGAPITKDQALSFLSSLPYKLLLDDDKLLICHAGLEEKYHLKESKKVQSKCLYGVTTGKTTEDGFPERLPWQDDYEGDRVVVHGHVAGYDPVITGNVYNIDTSCVYGGSLTALRYPEMVIIEQPALKLYYQKG